MFSLGFAKRVKFISGLTRVTILCLGVFILGLIFNLRLVMLYSFLSFIGIKIISGMMCTCPKCKTKFSKNIIQKLDVCEKCGCHLD